MRPVLHWRRGRIAIKEVDNLFPSHMEGFVITCVLEPFNLTWRVDGVASTIIGILMHDENHFVMVGKEEGSTGNNV